MARVVTWAGVSAYVYRTFGAAEFGLLALIRSTVGFMSYTSLGLGPAMVQALGQARGRETAASTEPTVPADAVASAQSITSGGSIPSSDALTPLTSATPVRPADEVPVAAQPLPSPDTLGYAPADLERREWEKRTPPTEEQKVYASGATLVGWLAVAACLLAVLGGMGLGPILPPYWTSTAVATAIVLALSLAVRVASEASSAALQIRGQLAVDNYILAGGELLVLAVVVVFQPASLVQVVLPWLVASLLIGIARAAMQRMYAPDLTENAYARQWPIARRLLGVGLLITVTQAADFLYAPSASLIVYWLLGPLEVAAYATAVQVDAALLLVVAGVASALYPRAAIAHGTGDLARVRAIYIKGTLVSAGLLTAAALVVWLLADPLFTLWLSTPQHASLAILPWVLVHTVVGGSSGIGRNVLLAMGRAGPLMVSALIGGLANVALGALLAGPAGLGLRGVVLATIIVVTARCTLWMPWYILRLTKP